MQRSLVALFVVILFAGCSTPRIKVDMIAEGGTASRTFASNALAADDVQRLREVYAAEPQADADIGGTSFSGSFGGQLPSEMGNRNGLVEVSTQLGTTHFYYEAFADGGSLWADFERRMQAGELWVRLFGRWAERQIEDPSKREEWRTYVDRDLVPLVNDAVLLWSAQLASVRFARVAQTLRDSADSSPITDDERFAQKAGMPLLLLFAERGLLTADEAHRLFLVSVDGNPSKAERTWIVDEILLPAMLREVRRFRPNAKAIDSAELVPMALSFWLYATTSSDRRDVLLASPAISEEDKSRLRAGRGSVELPIPFGIDPTRAAKKTDADVRLRTGVRPFAHNGQWDEVTKTVRFTSSFNERSRRTTLYPSVYFAAWSEPDEPAQRRIFGEVVLDSDQLTAYCLWREALPTALAKRWESALDELERTGVPTAVAALEAELRSTRPLPEQLRAWLRSRRVADATDYSSELWAIPRVKTRGL
ncbi:MAG: hypothetical protein SGJ09_08060 [Phycisphaerae bacterium]|nr:hypothetical protein [Phycisphaerae bacterium]